MATARYIYQHDRPRPAPRAVPTFATTASRSSAPQGWRTGIGTCNCREEGKGKNRAQIGWAGLAAAEAQEVQELWLQNECKQSTEFGLY